MTVRDAAGRRSSAAGLTVIETEALVFAPPSSVAVAVKCCARAKIVHGDAVGRRANDTDGISIREKFDLGDGAI